MTTVAVSDPSENIEPWIEDLAAIEFAHLDNADPVPAIGLYFGYPDIVAASTDESGQLWQLGLDDLAGEDVQSAIGLIDAGSALAAGLQREQRRVPGAAQAAA